jgi:uncharacterized protein (TIGR02217 family)
MAFHEVQFPPDISYGSSGGPAFKTSILPLTSGYEKRNIDWSLTKSMYDASHGVKTQVQLDELLEFFYARQGRAHGFRYKDWSDYQLAQQIIGTTDGNTNTFQTYKRYTSGNIDFDRTIVKLVASSYSVWHNSVLLTEGAGGTQYTIDINTGIVTLGATHAATSGEDVEILTEFDVPCRFDIDQMRVSIDYYNIYDWGQIPIVEIRDIV